MNDKLFDEVDRYIEDLFVPSDADLDATLRSTADAGMPPIQISPVHGKLLYIFAKTCGARRILELGTLAGYSTIWLARALPEGGDLISLESDPKYAEVAAANLAKAGLADRTVVRVGTALESLSAMTDEPGEPFDMVFMDADKESYSAYLSAVLPLMRPRGLIVADNVVRGGRVLAPDDDDIPAQGARDFNTAIAAEPRVEAVVLQVVGSKHHDGIAIAVVSG